MKPERQYRSRKKKKERKKRYYAITARDRRSVARVNKTGGKRKCLEHFHAVKSSRTSVTPL